MLARRVRTALGVVFLLALTVSPAAQAAAPSALTVEDAYQLIFEPAAPAPDVDPSEPQELVTYTYCCSASYCCDRVPVADCIASGGNQHQFLQSCELICRNPTSC
jgi:hypothetical protein